MALHEVRQARILSTERELREFDEFVEEAASGSGLAGCGPSERGGAQSAKCEAQSGELVWHELDDGAERCAGCGPSERGMGNIHQTVDWGLWQAKSKMRDKCWVVGVYEEKSAKCKARSGDSGVQSAECEVKSGDMDDLAHGVGGDVNTGGKLVAGAVIVRQRLPMGRCWLYVPRGPIWKDAGDLEAILGVVKGIAAQQKAVFLRVDPGVEMEGSEKCKAQSAKRRVRSEKCGYGGFGTWCRG